MSNDKWSGFCTDCGVRIEMDESTNLSACPMCGSTGIPCGDENQVTVSINWHELHVLCVWAERWGLEKVGGAGTVYAIARRLQQQHSDRPALTFAGEVNELKREYGAGNVETNVKGIE
jgi:hypothetical protein